VAGVQLILKGQPKMCWAIMRAHFAFYSKLNTVLSQRKQVHSIGEGSSTSILSKAPKSIVFSYFAAGKKLFSDLKK